MTHKKAILLFHKKYEYADGEIVEVKAWAELASWATTTPKGRGITNI